MKELIGKKIIGLRVGKEQAFLAFDHPGGESTVYVTGSDCCAETWFADIIGVMALLDATVTAVEEIEMDVCVDDGRCRQEVDAEYGYAIKTTAGRVDVIFRCSSNGYYGGSVGLLAPNKAPTDGWTQITDDWSA